MTERERKGKKGRKRKKERRKERKKEGRKEIRKGRKEASKLSIAQQGLSARLPLNGWRKCIMF